LVPNDRGKAAPPVTQLKEMHSALQAAGDPG
jgi:hypothetical protein